MAPPDNPTPPPPPPAKPISKDENQTSGNRKTSSTRPPELAPKCPRCDSANTKFCYYNNYSLSQPRHFCKTCRRYWTKGGALRNVPIGGGCRKNKKVKSLRGSGDLKDSGGSSEFGGLKFFNGFSPAVDFQVGGLSFPRINNNPSGIYNQFSSFGEIENNPSSGNPSNLMGFNYQFTSGGFNQEMGQNVHSNLASSIESLSSINQDLHWKLQQQRLGMLFGEEGQKEIQENQIQKPQPILFQNLEISKVGGNDDDDDSRKQGTNGEIVSEWLFGNNSYAPPLTATSANSSNWNNGIQAWSDLHQFNTLPFHLKND